MECEKCGAWMRRIMEPNGQVYWECPLCKNVIDTPDLAPSPIDGWRENNET